MKITKKMMIKFRAFSLPLRSMATCLLEPGMQGFLSDAGRQGRWLAYGGKKQPRHVKVLPSASIGSMPRGALRNTRPDW